MQYAITSYDFLGFPLRNHLHFLRKQERFLIERFLIHLGTSFLLLIITENHVSLLQFV